MEEGTPPFSEDFPLGVCPPRKEFFYTEAASCEFECAAEGLSVGPLGFAVRKRKQIKSVASNVAETEGFEPSVREYPVRRFSKPLVSATHPRLRMRQEWSLYTGASRRINRS